MDKREKVARAICAEKCSFMGEPPCYTVEGEWPNPNCQEPGCHAEADAAIAALEPAPVRTLTADECTRIVEATEPSEMTEAGDRRWTRRMGEALARALAGDEGER